MGFEVFLREHPLFHVNELEAYLKKQGKYNLSTLNAALQYHVREKHLARIRRGYYVVIGGYSRIQVEGDPILIASHMASDAIISHHTAMQFHALSYSVNAITYFYSDKRIGKFDCAYGRYQQIHHPSRLKLADRFVESDVYDRLGMDVRVTSIERTLVDSLHRPILSGGWEEIWRSFGSIGFLDVDRLIDYAISLCNATTIAKLGFFLEQHRLHFVVQDEQLSRLVRFAPRTRRYMDKKVRENVQSIGKWNLIVPMRIINQTWEEPNNDRI